MLGQVYMGSKAIYLQKLSQTSNYLEKLNCSLIMKVRPATAADVSAMVAVHMQSFKGFFLTFLGPAFLRELYAAILADPSGIGLVVADSQGVCGFVAGTAQTSGLYRRLIRQRWWRFALASMMPLLKRPSIAPRLLRAFSMPKQTAQAEAQPTGTLMSIAVSPQSQGTGAGRQLVQAFCAELGRHGVTSVCLTTDRDNNDRANRFYQNLGFRLSSTFTTPEGRTMNEYVLDLH